MSDHVAKWLRGVYSIPHSAIARHFRDRRTLRGGRWSQFPGIILLARTTLMGSLRACLKKRFLPGAVTYTVSSRGENIFKTVKNHIDMKRWVVAPHFRRSRCQ